MDSLPELTFRYKLLQFSITSNNIYQGIYETRWIIFFQSDTGRFCYFHRGASKHVFYKQTTGYLHFVTVKIMAQIPFRMENLYKLNQIDFCFIISSQSSYQYNIVSM